MPKPAKTVASPLSTTRKPDDMQREQSPADPTPRQHEQRTETRRPADPDTGDAAAADNSRSATSNIGVGNADETRTRR